jgi:hypothetical protein
VSGGLQKTVELVDMALVRYYIQEPLIPSEDVCVSVDAPAGQIMPERGSKILRIIPLPRPARPYNEVRM